MAKVLMIALFLSSGCGACNPSPVPPPPITISDASANTPPAIVYGELVEAGCLAPDDSGEGLVGIVDLQHSDAEPTWLSCLFDGNSVKFCSPPCQ